MKIVISTRAERELRKLPKFDQLAIARKIRLLTQNVTLLTVEKSINSQPIFLNRIVNK